MQLNCSASALQIGEIISANLLHIQYAVKQNFQNQDAVNMQLICNTKQLHCTACLIFIRATQGRREPERPRVIICVPAPSDIISFNRLS